MVRTITTMVITLIIVLMAETLGGANLNYVINIEKINKHRYEKELMGSVHVTMYNPVRAQTDNTPNIVADGSRFHIPTASSLKWIAVSRDLHVRWGGTLDFGDIVYLSIPENTIKSGHYLVKDTMNERWKSRIDILESPGYPLYRYSNVSLYRVIPIEGTTKKELWDSYLAP